MSNKFKFDISQVNAFNSIDNSVVSELYKNSEKVVFDMGSPITFKNEISNKVYIMGVYV